MNNRADQRAGLCTGEGVPGSEWGPFSAKFDRESSSAMSALGYVAATMTLQVPVSARQAIFEEAIDDFADSAEPSLSGHARSSFRAGATNALLDSEQVSPFRSPHHVMITREDRLGSEEI